MKWRRPVFTFAVLLAASVGGYGWHRLQREQKFLPQIRSAAEQYKVDPSLVRAVVWRESRFDPDARGKKGEVGLMQIRDAAAREWADAEHVHSFEFNDCLNAQTNILAATFYLSKLLKRYKQTDNPVPYALANYNAGRSNIKKWDYGAGATNSAAFFQQIGFPRTRKYIKSVMRRCAFYHFLNRTGMD